MSVNPELLARQKAERLKQYAIMNCGVGCCIIEYGGAQNITVKFDNGDIVKASYQNFRLGCIKSPTAYKEKEDNLHIGEVKQFQNGGHGKLVRRTNNTKLAGGHPSRTYIVRYEEDGYETEVTYPQFQSGRVFHPIFNKKLASTSNSKSNEYIGKVFPLDCGVSVEIINYYPNKKEARCDVKVVGKENHLLRGVGIKSIKSGKYFPAIIRIGEKQKMSNGQVAEIIDINDSGGVVSVKFEDGTIVKNKKYGAFIKGEIGNPNISSADLHSKKDQRLHTKHVMKNGISLEVIKYNTEEDVDIVFEDGTRVKGVSYSQIRRKSLQHPNIKPSGVGSFLAFELDGILKRDESETYYKCRCLKCDLEEALTPQEMLKHKCN